MGTVSPRKCTYKDHLSIIIFILIYFSFNLWWGTGKMLFPYFSETFLFFCSKWCSQPFHRQWKYQATVPDQPPQKIQKETYISSTFSWLIDAAVPLLLLASPFWFWSWFVFSFSPSLLLPTCLTVASCLALSLLICSASSSSFLALSWHAKVAHYQYIASWISQN